MSFILHDAMLSRQTLLITGLSQFEARLLTGVHHAVRRCSVGDSDSVGVYSLLHLGLDSLYRTILGRSGAFHCHFVFEACLIRSLT